MTLHFPNSKLSKPIWQVLAAPMLLASLGLHGLFLMLPTGASDQAAIPPPDPEQDSVAITRVPPAAGAEPPSNPWSGASPVGTPVAAQPLSRPIQPLPQPSQNRDARPSVAAGARSQGNRPSAPPTPRTHSLGQAVDPSTTQATSPRPNSPTSEASQPLFDPDLGERLMAYATSLSLPQSQIDRLKTSLQDRFGYAQAATTRDVYSTNLRAWEADIQQITGIADLSAEVDRSDFSVTYPQRVCLMNEPGEARFGVLVNPDGSQQGEPTLLRSSGYGALDQRALQVVQSHSFAPAESIKAYTVSVRIAVDYGLRPCLRARPEP